MTQANLRLSGGQISLPGKGLFEADLAGVSTYGAKLVL